MSEEFNHSNKPANPAPPLNALQKPSVKKQKPVVHRSVYDEIAERRKHEKHKIGVTYNEDAEPEKKRFYLGDEVSEIIDEVKQNKPADEPPADDDVKIYNPSEGGEIFSDTHKLPVDEILDKNVEYSYPRESGDNPDEDNYDVVPIPDPPKRNGVWVALISVLGGLCIIAAGAYGAVNGYFDGLIKML